jgi:uncharacterized DUF497 family protein
MDMIHGDFIWNSHKERANVLKHQVDFFCAVRAFSDPERRIIKDELHSISEDRYFCLGKVGGRVLTVRFVYRENRIRILGAGNWRKGKELYGQKKDRL